MDDYENIDAKNWIWCHNFVAQKFIKISIFAEYSNKRSCQTFQCSHTEKSSYLSVQQGLQKLTSTLSCKISHAYSNILAFWQNLSSVTRL